MRVLAYSFCPIVDHLKKNCTLENPGSDEQLVKNKSPESSSMEGSKDLYTLLFVLLCFSGLFCLKT